jgi:hypothetical protein
LQARNQLIHRLKTLNLTQNQISKIEGLEHLTSLKRLFLAKNNIKKIENLENLFNLEELYFSYQNVRDEEGDKVKASIEFSPDCFIRNKKLRTFEGDGNLYSDFNPISK